MNSHGRFTLWLQEHFSFFKSEPLFDQHLVEYLQGNMRELVPSARHALSYDVSFNVIIESKLGSVLYDREKTRTCKPVSIEKVEFIPHTGKGFSLTFVNNEFSVLRSNGSDPVYSPEVSIAEMAAISVFMSALRQKTEEFLKTGHC